MKAIITNNNGKGFEATVLDRSSSIDQVIDAIGSKTFCASIIIEADDDEQDELTADLGDDQDMRSVVKNVIILLGDLEKIEQDNVLLTESLTLALTRMIMGYEINDWGDAWLTESINSGRLHPEIIDWLDRYQIIDLVDPDDETWEEKNDIVLWELGGTLVTKIKNNN